MDGENNGKPNFLMDDLGGKNPYFWKHLYVFIPWGMIQFDKYSLTTVAWNHIVFE